MGPKKGKGKGGPVDGVDTTSMSREQLEAFSLRLREELDREREERNFFQLERDKLRTFWEITRQQYEENRAQLRNQDRVQDENEEKHQSEIKAFKQKVKHLLYEHQCSLSDLKVEGVVAQKMAQDEYTAMENELLKDKNALKAKLKEQELAHQEVIRQIKMEHSAAVRKLREQFAQDSSELEKKYEARLGSQYEEQGLQHSMELAEVEQRKNRHIVELTKSHEQAFNDMKNYYNDITLNNLALISSLKEQMEELRNGHERMEKQLREVQGENKRLSEPLKQARTELSNLQRQLASYEQDKITLVNTKQRLALVTKELEDLRWENEVLELRFDKVEKERNRLHQEFVGAVLDVQQKTGLKSAMLEKKVADLRGGSVSRPAGGRYRSRARRAPLRTPLLNPKQVWSPPEQTRKSAVRRAIPRLAVAPGSSDLSSCSCEDISRSQPCLVLRNRCSVCVVTRTIRCPHRAHASSQKRSHSHRDIVNKRPRCGRRCKKCRRSAVDSDLPLCRVSVNDIDNSKPDGSPDMFSSAPKEDSSELQKVTGIHESFVSGCPPSVIVMSLHENIVFPSTSSQNVGSKLEERPEKKLRSAVTEHSIKALAVRREQLLEVKHSNAQMSLPTISSRFSYQPLPAFTEEEIPELEIGEEIEKDIFIGSSPSQESVVAEPFQSIHDEQLRPTIVVTGALSVESEPSDAESLPGPIEEEGAPEVSEGRPTSAPIDLQRTAICLEKSSFPDVRPPSKETPRKDFKGAPPRTRPEARKTPLKLKESAWAKAPERDTGPFGTRRGRPPTIGLERKLPQARSKSAGSSRPKSPERDRGRSPGAALPSALNRHAICLTTNTSRMFPLPPVAQVIPAGRRGRESMGIQAIPRTLETSTSVETVYKAESSDFRSLRRSSVSTQWSRSTVLSDIERASFAPEPVPLKPVRRSFGDTSLPITTSFLPTSAAIVEEEEDGVRLWMPDADPTEESVLRRRSDSLQINAGKRSSHSGSIDTSQNKRPATSPSISKKKSSRMGSSTVTFSDKNAKKPKSTRDSQSSQASWTAPLARPAGQPPPDARKPRPPPAAKERKAIRAGPRKSEQTGGKLASALFTEPQADAKRVPAATSQVPEVDTPAAVQTYPYTCDASCEVHLPERHEALSSVDTESLLEAPLEVTADVPAAAGAPADDSRRRDAGTQDSFEEPGVVSRASSAISLRALGHPERPSSRSFGTSAINLADPSDGENDHPDDGAGGISEPLVRDASVSPEIKEEDGMSRASSGSRLEIPLIRVDDNELIEDMVEEALELVEHSPQVSSLRKEHAVPHETPSHTKPDFVRSSTGGPRVVPQAAPGSRSPSQKEMIFHTTKEEIAILSTGALGNDSSRVVLTRRVTSSIRSRVSLPTEQVPSSEAEQKHESDKTPQPTPQASYSKSGLVESPVAGTTSPAPPDLQENPSVKSSGSDVVETSSAIVTTQNESSGTIVEKHPSTLINSEEVHITQSIPKLSISLESIPTIRSGSRSSSETTAVSGTRLEESDGLPKPAENATPEENSEQSNPSLISDATIVGDVADDYEPNQDEEMAQRLFKQKVLDKGKTLKDRLAHEYAEESEPVRSRSASVGTDEGSDETDSSSSSTLKDEECDDEGKNVEKYKKPRNPLDGGAVAQLGLKPSSTSLTRRHRRSKSIEDLRGLGDECFQGHTRQHDAKPLKSATKPSSAGLTASAKVRTDLKTKSQGAKVFIKDVFRVLTTGKWPIKRNVMTSTSDLIRAPRSRSAPPRASMSHSKTELFTKDRHAACYHSNAPRLARPEHCKASSADSSSVPLKSSRRSRSKPQPTSSRSKKTFHHSQLSVRFDFHDSDTNVSTGGGQCHMATWTDSVPSSDDSDVSRAKSLPQLPRRGGLKRSSRGDPEKRSRCRSEGRLTQAASCSSADEVISSRASSKTAFERHKHCYEERRIFPPIPSSRAPPSRKSRPRARGSSKRKAPHGGAPKAPEQQDAAKSKPRSDKDVIWTKPGRNDVATKSGRSTWLMFPSVVAARSQVDFSASLRRSVKEDERSGSTRPCRSEPSREAIGADCPRGSRDVESRQSSARILKEQPSDANTSKRLTPTQSRVSLFGTGERGSSDERCSSSSSAEAVRVTSLPLVTFPSGASSPRLCEQPAGNRITIQEISTEDSAPEERSGAASGAAASRLSCLREETDSDVNVDSFNVSHPVSLTSSQAEVWHALEETLSGPHRRRRKGSSPKVTAGKEDYAARRPPPNSERVSDGGVSQKHSADRAHAAFLRPARESAEHRTPRVRFSEEEQPSETTDDDLENVVASHFRRLQKCSSSRTTPKQSRSLTSTKCPSPISSSSAAASALDYPTKILVSRAKSTASLTGIHDQPITQAASSTESISKIFGSPGRNVMVVELFRKHHPHDSNTGNQSPP